MQYCRIGCAGARSIADQVLLNSRVRPAAPRPLSSVAMCVHAASGWPPFLASLNGTVTGTVQVTQLDLQGNEIGTAGFIAIMDALRKNVNLERLNVADNAIDETLYSMEKLCSMMHLNRTLKHLNMKVAIRLTGHAHVASVTQPRTSCFTRFVFGEYEPILMHTCAVQPHRQSRRGAYHRGAEGGRGFCPLEPVGNAA